MAIKKGSKLNRTEIFNVRLDPILKWAAELAAAKERRTLSSYTEWAVEQATKQTMVARDEKNDLVSAWRVAQECWVVEPDIRIKILAERYPDLLTIRERKIVEAMSWVKHFVEGLGEITDLVRIMLIMRGWDDFCRYADDQISLEEVLNRLRNIRATMDQDGTITTVDQAGDYHETHSPCSS